MRRARCDNSTCLRVLFGDIFETELLRLKEGVLLIERSVVEKFAGGYSQGFGYGLDDIGGGVLAALLNVAQVALGDPGFVGEGLQGEIAVRAKSADRESYVVGESPLRHSFTPESEGCVDEKASEPYVLQCMRWHARMQPQG